MIWASRARRKKKTSPTTCIKRMTLTLSEVRTHRYCNNGNYNGCTGWSDKHRIHSTFSYPRQIAMLILDVLRCLLYRNKQRKHYLVVPPFCFCQSKCKRIWCLDSYRIKRGKFEGRLMISWSKNLWSSWDRSHFRQFEFSAHYRLMSIDNANGNSKTNESDEKNCSCLRQGKIIEI